MPRRESKLQPFQRSGCPGGDDTQPTEPYQSGLFMRTLKFQMYYVVARPEDGPVTLIFWYSCSFCVPFLHWIMTTLCDQHNTVEVTGVTSQAKSEKILPLPPWPLLCITCSKGRQLSCHGGVQAALWRSPCGEELKPYTKSHNQLVRIWVHLCASSFSTRWPTPGKFLDDCSPTQHLDCNLMRDMRPEPWSSAAS